MCHLLFRAVGRQRDLCTKNISDTTWGDCHKFSPFCHEFTLKICHKLSSLYFHSLKTRERHVESALRFPRPLFMRTRIFSPLCLLCRHESESKRQCFLLGTKRAREPFDPLATLRRILPGLLGLLLSIALSFPENFLHETHHERQRPWPVD